MLIYPFNGNRIKGVLYHFLNTYEGTAYACVHIFKDDDYYSYPVPDIDVYNKLPENHYFFNNPDVIRNLKVFEYYYTKDAELPVEALQYQKELQLKLLLLES